MTLSGDKTIFVAASRRKLKADISAAFPSLSADELSELVPNKEELNVVKVYAHKGDAVTLYVLHKNPVFFELEKRLFPTGNKPAMNTHIWNTLRYTSLLLTLSYFLVYVLWRYPALLPTFKTWPLVLQKLAGGAGGLSFLLRSVSPVQVLYVFKLWENIVLFQRSHATRCGGAFMWSPSCETGGQLCCYISEQQVCYNKCFGKTFPAFLKNVSVTLSSCVFVELLLQLEQLQCPLKRCTV